MSLEVSIVDTMKRYTKLDKECLSSEVLLWKEDYAWIQVLVKVDKTCKLSLNIKCDDGIIVDSFMLENTLAFIGSAGYKAENPFSIMPRGPKKSVGDVIVPFKEEDVSSFKVLLFKVSSQDSVGKKNIEITILADKEEKKLDIGANIINLQAPKPQDYSFNVEYWQHPYNVSDYYNVEPFSSKHLDILKEHQLLYKNLGGKAVTCTVLDEVWGGQTYGKGKIKYPSMVKWLYDGNKYHFDYSILDKWVMLNIDCGLDNKFVCYSMMPWGNKMRYYDEIKGKYKTKKVPLMSKEYVDMWSCFLQDFIKHLDEMNWFDKFYVGFDERNNMKEVLDLVESFKNKEGKSLKISASFNNYISNKACLDRIDSASVGLYEVKAHEKEYLEIVKERKLLGKETTMYTATDHYPNSFALSIPAESYWSIMYALASGNDGFLRWAYDAWVEDPLKDTTHFSFQAGDCFLIYPAKEGYIPNLSFRMLKLDEGVRDANKLNMLKKNPKNVACIEKLLSKVWKDYSKRVEYSMFWGPCIHKAYWADEQAIEDISNDMIMLKKEIEKLAIEEINV